MKHPVRDRLIIIFSSIILFVLAVAGLLLVTGIADKFMHFSPSALAWLSDLRLPVRMGAAIGFALLAIVAILNFSIIFPAKKKRDLAYTIQHAENGELKISLEAISHLVNKCIERHTELSGVQSKITSNEESVTVELHVTLSTDINIPMAVTALQKEIKQYVEATSGVHVDEIRVVVDSTTALPEGAAGSPYVIPEMMQPTIPEAHATPEIPAAPEAPADDAHMYTFQEEPAYKPLTPPEPPVNAYGDAQAAQAEDDHNELPESEMPEDTDADAYLTERLSQMKADPETDVWMMGAQAPLPQESEEEDEA